MKSLLAGLGVLACAMLLGYAGPNPAFAQQARGGGVGDGECQYCEEWFEDGHIHLGCAVTDYETIPGYQSCDAHQNGTDPDSWYCAGTPTEPLCFDPEGSLLLVQVLPEGRVWYAMANQEPGSPSRDCRGQVIATDDAVTMPRTQADLVEFTL